MKSDAAVGRVRPPQVLLAERTIVAQVSTTEVRWILPGDLPPDVAGWFAPFVSQHESRDDWYLMRPQPDGLSVKIRGGSSLDVKVHAETDEAPISVGPLTGRTHACQKWSFAFRTPCDRARLEGTGWQAVGKVRRLIRFSPGGRPLPPPAPGQPAPLGCAVELTDITLADRRWWTLGFEASGPAAGRRSSIEAAAAALFARSLPASRHLDTDRCTSYPAWLAGQSDALRQPGRGRALP